MPGGAVANRCQSWWCAGGPCAGREGSRRRRDESEEKVEKTFASIARSPPFGPSRRQGTVLPFFRIRFFPLKRRLEPALPGTTGILRRVSRRSDPRILRGAISLARITWRASSFSVCSLATAKKQDLCRRADVGHTQTAKD